MCILKTYTIYLGIKIILNQSDIYTLRVPSTLFLYSILFDSQQSISSIEIIVFLCEGATEYFYDSSMATKVLKFFFMFFQIRREPMPLSICVQREGNISRKGRFSLGTVAEFCPLLTWKRTTQSSSQGNTTSNLSGEENMCICSS